MSRWLKWPKTPTLKRVACAYLPNHLDQHPLMLTKCSKLVYRAGLHPSGWVMMAQCPLCGDARSSHSIVVEGETVAQKLMCGLALQFHAPQSYELAISRMKRGEIEFIIAGHILQASLVWSVPLPQEWWHWCLHTPGPSTSNSSPLFQCGHSGRHQEDSTELPDHPT